MGSRLSIGGGGYESLKEKDLRIGEVADLLAISTRTVRRWWKKGLLPPPHLQKPRMVRWSPIVIPEWVAAGCPAMTSSTYKQLLIEHRKREELGTSLTHHRPLLLSAKVIAEARDMSVRSVWRFTAIEVMPQPVLRIGNVTRWSAFEMDHWPRGPEGDNDQIRRAA